MIKDLRLVEIELFSYCNRVCNWCPNKEIDRRSFNKEIEDDILFGVLKDLKDNKYRGAITFSRYNEPLSKPEIFKKRLHQIKEYLPNNKLITNTNGDFITKENLDGLLVDELTIMDYDNAGIDKCIDKLVDAGATITEIKEPNYVYATRGDMQILYYLNWGDNRNITDRGGFLKEYSGDVRVKPCFEPKYFVGINYDGTVSSCCNIRNDIKQHQNFVSGDLHNSSLSEILSSEASTRFKTDCQNGIFKIDSPCYTCTNAGGRYTKGNGGISYA